MSEDEKTEEAQSEPDPEEEKFWARMAEIQESALDRWASKISAEIDQQEEQSEDAKGKTKEDDDRRGSESGKSSDAEQRWESGRATARQSFGSKIYKWTRPALYGKKKES